MKITGGSLKGRNMTIAGNGVARYTSSKIREALFDMIGDIQDNKVLDLFAGSGSFAIEAFSRGAAFATCVEKDKHTVIALKNNLMHLSLNNYCHVLNMDVRYAIPFLYKKAYIYDIIFMDPPYERGYILKTMSLLKNNVIYDKNTTFILEHSKRETLNFSTFDGWDEITIRRHGDTVISMCKPDYSFLMKYKES
jgi:16S rRNA (guanine(966)-N(2))-methyltransferase RsmD